MNLLAKYDFKSSENNIMNIFWIILIIFPLVGSPYDVLNMTYFLTMSLLSISLWVIWGLTGIFSFGQTAFFGVGAYAYALVSLNFETLNITFFALIIALVLGWIFAFILGYFMFYGGVNDVFVGIITLCVTLVLSTFLAQSAGSEWKLGEVLLGGDNGINNIPALGVQFGTEIYSLKGISLYFFILLIIIFLYFLFKFNEKGKLGYSFIAIRENRERSLLLGYNIPFLQTISFAFGGMIAALSGVLFVMWGGYISPSSMGLSAAALPVVLVAAGGRTNLSSAFLFSLLYFYFSQKLSVTGSEYALIILGVLLVVVILILPKGLITAAFNILDKLLFKRGS